MWFRCLFPAQWGIMIVALSAPCLFFGQDAEVFPPVSPKRSVSAAPVDENLRIDGVLNETAWSQARVVSDFIQVEPLQGEAASQQTVVRILYNRKFLYVGVEANDPLGKSALRAVDFRRDFDFQQHDLVNISIDGFLDERNAMVFATNPYGVQRDLLAFDDTYFDLDWDGLWRVRTTRTDSGWVAEFAIPWQTLRYPRSVDSLQSWGINIYRNRRMTNEITALSPFPRSFSATRMDYAANLDGLMPPPPKPNIRVQPFTLVSNDRYRTPDQNLSHTEQNFKVGGDLKWAISPNTVLDLTANTDFAQADVDRQVNNITRFSVFFPERRQFFLENASLFGFNILQAKDGSGGSMALQPFFSRTIGLDDSGRPIPIDAGGRLVHRSNTANYGVIAMRQRATDQHSATNFLVSRYSHNLGNQSRIGGLVTLKNRADATHFSGTLDGFFRLGESQYINTMLVHSSGGQAGGSGFAGIAQFYHTSNSLKLWLTQSFVTKNFNPEMGFVARKDVIGTTPGGSWFYRGKYLPFRKYIRAYEPGFLPEFYWQASTGTFLESQLSFFPIWFNFQQGGFFGYSVNPVFQRLVEPFEPLGVTIQPGDYRYFRQSVWFSTDPSRIVSLFSNNEWGAYFDGRLASVQATLVFAPSPHFSFNGQLNRIHFEGVGGTTGAQTVNLFGLEGRFALNPRLQLIGFYQQNSENDSKNYNIRLSWEYQPLSFVYIVVNKFDYLDPLKVRQIEDNSIVKLSILRQF